MEFPKFWFIEMLGNLIPIQFPELARASVNLKSLQPWQPLSKVNGCSCYYYEESCFLEYDDLLVFRNHGYIAIPILVAVVDGDRGNFCLRFDRSDLQILSKSDLFLCATRYCSYFFTKINHQRRTDLNSTYGEPLTYIAANLNWALLRRIHNILNWRDSNILQCATQRDPKTVRNVFLILSPPAAFELLDGVRFSWRIDYKSDFQGSYMV